MSFDQLALGFGIYVIVYALMFLGLLPFIAERHRRGDDIAPSLRRISLWNIPASALLTIAISFWLL